MAKKADFRKLAARFKVLASPLRLGVLDLLGTSPLTIDEMVDSLEITRSSLNADLRVLRLVGLVEVEREDKSNRYSLTRDGKLDLSLVLAARRPGA